MNNAAAQSESAGPNISAVLSSLPALPPHLRYVDFHDDSTRTIRRPAEEDMWSIHWDTETLDMDFGLFSEPDVKLLAKWFISWLLANGAVGSVQSHWYPMRALYKKDGAAWFRQAVFRSPIEWRTYWEEKVGPNASASTAQTVKMLLHFLADFSLASWTRKHRNYIRSFRHQTVGKRGAGVISGSAILSVSEETCLIGYFDEVSGWVRDGARLSTHALLTFCLTCMSYQHGLRSVQMSRMRVRDLRLYQGDDGTPIVHFVGRRAKKRRDEDRSFFTRKVKREWAWPFAAYFRMRFDEVPDGDAEAFPVPRATIRSLVSDQVELATGTRRSITDLRHSAAQRLADAGASVEEVANFLGHSHWETSLIYFEASESQAEQINKALSLNPVYREIRKVAETGTIDKARLLGLAADNQIGGVPHGLPISGIGGCRVGQSLCELNPVLSCYLCRKFIPVDDIALHRQVLQDLRSVVRFFFDESRGQRQSPAFAQLRTTLAAVERLIAELEQDTAKEATSHE